jgi:hypothetical protein
VDGSGTLFVTDSANHAIRKITPSGTNWVTTTIAGGGIPGSQDGTNTFARFSTPHDLAIDGAGNLFVADQNNYAIRKITPVDTNWVVTTIAGGKFKGTTDGTNGGAEFSFPESIAVDTNGNLFVADTDAIREIVPVGTNWVVTTIAGSVLDFANVDGTNDAARFGNVHGLELDSAGNIYVTDTFNELIRKMTHVGTNWVVTTLAGSPVTTGTNDGAGSDARFSSPASVVIDSFGNLFVADYSTSIIRKGFPFAITNQPQSQGAMIGTDVTLSASLFGDGPFSYQWFFAGMPLNAQTNATLALNSVQRTNSGLYSVSVTSSVDTNDVISSTNAMLRVLIPPVLRSPEVATDGVVRLQFQDADGGVPYDLNSVEVQWRTNLPSGEDTIWQSLATGFYPTNGMIAIDETNTTGLPSCFFRVIER